MVVRRRIIRLCIPGHATISLLVDDEQVRIVDTQGTERPRHGTYVHHDGGIIVAFSPTSTDDRPLSVYRFEAYPMVIGVYRSHNFRGILLDPDTINIASESLLKTFCDQMQYRVVQKQWKRPADCVKKCCSGFTQATNPSKLSTYGTAKLWVGRPCYRDPSKNAASPTANGANSSKTAGNRLASNSTRRHWAEKATRSSSCTSINSSRNNYLYKKVRTGHSTRATAEQTWALAGKGLTRHSS